MPMEEWEAHCREVDILISSTAGRTPIVTRQNLGPLLHDRLDRPLFIIDIAVPRDVAPDVNELEGVFLYDIDSLQDSRSSRSPCGGNKSPPERKLSQDMSTISAVGSCRRGNGC